MRPEQEVPPFVHGVPEEVKAYALPDDDEGHGRQIRSFGGDGSGGVIEALPLYFQEAGKIPLLTAEQEVELAKAIEVGEKAKQWFQKENILLPEKQTDAQAFEKAKRRLPKTIFPLEDIQDTYTGHTREDEIRQRLLQIETGDNARKALIEANLRLVVSVARRYMNRGLPLGDLIQEGNIGLGRAVGKFDYRRGFKFSTYATWWIRQAVSRALAEQSRIIRLPVHMNEFVGKMGNAERELRAALGRKPTDAEIASKLETTVQRIRDVKMAILTPFSLEQPVGEGEDSAEFHEFIEDESLPDMDEEAGKRELRERVASVLHTLTPREQKVVELRFGIYDDKLWTLSEIGEAFGVTRERIRQIEAKAMRKLRQGSRRVSLRELVE